MSLSTSCTPMSYSVHHRPFKVAASLSPPWESALISPFEMSQRSLTTSLFAAVDTPLAPLECMGCVLDPLQSLSGSRTSSKLIAFGDPNIRCLWVQRGR